MVKTPCFYCRVARVWSLVGELTSRMCVCMLSHVRRFVTSWTVALLSMGILQARILEWVAISSSKGSSQPRDQTGVSCIGRQILLPLNHLGSPFKIPHATKRQTQKSKNNNKQTVPVAHVALISGDVADSMGECRNQQIRALTCKCVFNKACVYTHTHTHTLFHILFHSRLLQGTEYSSLFYTVGVFCLFRTLISNHPHLEPCSHDSSLKQCIPLYTHFRTLNPLASHLICLLCKDPHQL